MFKNINFRLTGIHSSCVKALGLRLMRLRKETKCISTHGALRQLQIYPKCVASGKCEATSVLVVSAH